MFLLLSSHNYVVSVRSGFFFLLVPGQAGYFTLVLPGHSI